MLKIAQALEPDRAGGQAAGAAVPHPHLSPPSSEVFLSEKGDTDEGLRNWGSINTCMPARAPNKNTLSSKSNACQARGSPAVKLFAEAEGSVSNRLNYTPDPAGLYSEGDGLTKLHRL